MTNNPIIPVNPLAGADDEPDEPIQEVDGQEVLDPDADPDRVDSAEADRLATGADRSDDEAIDLPDAP